MESPPLPTSASPTAHLPPAESPARPPLTTDSTSSHFADSGLGTIGLHTPSPRRKSSPKTPQQNTLASPSKTTNSISSRLEQLAALAWEAEADDRLDERTRAAVQSQLHAIEAQLEGRTRGNEQTSSDVDLSNSASPTASGASSILSPSLSHGTPAKEPPELEPASAPDLNPVLSHLAATVASMRTRLSESKHLHGLALSKLSSIAQDNVDLTSQLTTTQKKNTSLSHANAALRMRLDDLEATTTQQAIAVSAMTGAVAGLESYVRSSSPTPSTPRTQHIQPNGYSQHTPNSSVRRQTTIRGSGRFRGKYPVSHLERRASSDTNMNLDGAHDLPLDLRQSELQEGILAWVRGFRDVEASWREMDLHRTPTRFGNGHGNNVTEIQDTPQTPTRRGQRPGAETEGEERASERVASRSRSRSEEESVLFQGDKAGGSDIDVFGGQEDEFGEFQSVTNDE